MVSQNMILASLDLRMLNLAMKGVILLFLNTWTLMMQRRFDFFDPRTDPIGMTLEFARAVTFCVVQVNLHLPELIRRVMQREGDLEEGQIGLLELILKGSENGWRDRHDRALVVTTTTCIDQGEGAGEGKSDGAPRFKKLRLHFEYWTPPL